MTNVSIKWLSEVCSLQCEVRGHSSVLTQRCHSLSVTKQENKKARVFTPKQQSQKTCHITGGLRFYSLRLWPHSDNVPGFSLITCKWFMLPVAHRMGLALSPWRLSPPRPKDEGRGGEANFFLGAQVI